MERPVSQSEGAAENETANDVEKEFYFDAEFGIVESGDNLTQRAPHLASHTASGKNIRVPDVGMKIATAPGKPKRPIGAQLNNWDQARELRKYVSTRVCDNDEIISYGGCQSRRFDDSKSSPRFKHIYLEKGNVDTSKINEDQQASTKLDEEKLPVVEEYTNTSPLIHTEAKSTAASGVSPDTDESLCLMLIETVVPLIRNALPEAASDDIIIAELVKIINVTLVEPATEFVKHVTVNEKQVHIVGAKNEPIRSSSSDETNIRQGHQTPYLSNQLAGTSGQLVRTCSKKIVINTSIASSLEGRGVPSPKYAQEYLALSNESCPSGVLTGRALDGPSSDVDQILPSNSEQRKHSSDTPQGMDGPDSIRQHLDLAPGVHAVTTSKYTCVDCPEPRKFINLSGYKEHCRRIHGEKFECPHCNKIFRAKSGLISHEKTCREKSK